MILVSGCLVGENCKYHGGSNDHPAVRQYLQGKEYLTVCPELLGGLPVPRPPVELQGGGGKAFWQGQARAMAKDGQDCSAQFAAGANAVLQLCLEQQVQLVILKEASPSCGSSQIYDGSFCGGKIPGQGVCAALLQANGITVISEDQLFAEPKQLL